MKWIFYFSVITLLFFGCSNQRESELGVKFDTWNPDNGVSLLSYERKDGIWITISTIPLEKGLNSKLIITSENAKKLSPNIYYGYPGKVKLIGRNAARNFFITKMQE